jgi:transcriptional regulator with XRE-family HTH domain
VAGIIRRTAKQVNDKALPIGGRLRATRLARGLTLGQVAAAAGLTEGFVSKLERDQVSPSVASLVSVCEALGLRVGELFEPPTSAIVRSGEGAKINWGGINAREYLLSPGSQAHIEVLHSIVEPKGSGGDELYALDTEIEFVYVLKGQFDIVLGPSTHHLTVGDAMTFRGREPHTWRNPSTTDIAEVLWVLSPAP